MTEQTDTGLQAPDAGNDTRNLTLLLVEDDLLSREMLLVQLDGVFNRILAAADGLEGLQLFRDCNPDIVLTDQIMPGLSGLELLGKIRSTGAKTPVVLMTSSIDNQFLLDAVNLGADRFVPKPFELGQLLRALGSICTDIVNARLIEQHRLQEVELLRYRDSYHSMQQESARRKERHVVRHDLCNRALQGAGGIRWGINVAYSPHDIMCGDGYSVRNLFDGRQLILVVDAMGSGMSASLTTMLATSFFNYQVENLHMWGTFTLRMFLKRFTEYLASMLLEEEVLSCGFFLVDLKKEEIEIALFALPPLLIRNLDGSVRRMRGENPPLGIYPSDIRVSTIALSDVADLLVMTDGVSDAPIAQGGSYREELEGDFHAAPTLAAFQRRFRHKTDQSAADDMTLLHLRRLDFEVDWIWSGKPELTLCGLSRLIHDFLDDLANQVDLDASDCDTLEAILTETLTNALEFGCLGIHREEKTRLLLAGNYEMVLKQKTANPDAGIVLSATLWQAAEIPLLLLEVRDTGPGLLDNALRQSADENVGTESGLRKISRLCDSLFIDEPGGCLIILKSLEGGTAYAD